MTLENVSDESEYAITTVDTNLSRLRQANGVYHKA